MSVDDARAPAETHEALMDATYRALCAHGYANLTMQAIADEAEKSKSLLHYHYDTKEDLLVSFLAYLLEEFDEKVESMAVEEPVERLERLIDMFLPSDADGDEDYDRFQLALLELRAQAPYSDAYREQLRRNKTSVQNRLAETIRDGVEGGVFADDDPEATAQFIVATLDGARAARATLGDDEDLGVVREQLHRYVVDELRAEAER